MPRRLVIMRHGEAVPYTARAEDDHGRVLTLLGQGEALSVAQQLHSILGGTCLVASSDAARAKATAQIVHREIPGAQFRLYPEFYSGGEDQIIETVIENIEKFENIVCVGHNPGWSAAVENLSHRACRLGTANAAVLSLPEPIGNWTEKLFNLALQQILVPKA